MPIVPLKIESKHYMVLPAPKFWNSPSNANFLINFSGVAILDNFKGNANGSWHNDELDISALLMGMDQILQRVQSVLPALPPGAFEHTFIPLQWTAYGSVNSQFDEQTSVNAGFGAYNFGITRSVANLNASNSQQVKNFSGMFVNVQARDKDAILYRVGYSINVYGYFVANFPLNVGG